MVEEILTLDFVLKINEKPNLLSQFSFMTSKF